MDEDEERETNLELRPVESAGGQEEATDKAEARVRRGSDAAATAKRGRPLLWIWMN